MNTLEERLRNDLPALADALLERHSARIEMPEFGAASSEASVEPNARTVSRRRFLVAAAVASASAAVGLTIRARLLEDGTVRIDTAGSPAPASFGTWSPMAEAPIEPRPFAASAWTGSQVVFWAGSSLSRGFAFTDGALYDPATDTWETMTVPGWGHPGLTSAFFDGELYALAKGGGTRFDPVAGEWRDLPPVEGMYLAATVASGDGIWGLGPADLNPAGQPDLAIARYVPGEDRWVYGPTWEGTSPHAAIVDELSRLEATVLWTGTEIVACGRSGLCLGFDPDSETWRTIPSAGAGATPVAVATEHGLAMVVRSESERSLVAVEVYTGEEWQQRVVGIPVARIDTVTAVAAGDWLVIFSSGQPPTLVHLPSGVWLADDGGPLAGVEAPNAVWTGDQLVVWGGVPDDPSAESGAVWSPPRS